MNQKIQCHTNVSAVPLTTSINGAEPTRVTSHPLARPTSGDPPRTATKLNREHSSPELRET
jgi:hypothetical protein